MEPFRPRFKPEHSRFRTDGHRVRIGGWVYGIAAEVDDPTGAVWTLLDLMDGTRTADEIVAGVLRACPNEEESAVRAAVDVFADSGYVDNAAAADPAVLTERDKQRYDRGRRYYRWIGPSTRATSWEPQVRLRSARVTVVGVGGVGSNVAMALAASGVGDLQLIDRDVVELSNLNRQLLFTERDVGRPKVDAAVERLLQLNSDIRITGAQQTIADEADLRSLAGDCDVLMLCADEPGDIRAWTNRACLATGTPWVDAGYHGPVASVAAYVPQAGGACFDCAQLDAADRSAAVGIDREGTVGRRGPHAVVAPTAGVCGHLAAHLGVALLTGVVPVRSGRLVGINLIAPDQQLLNEAERRPDCPTCGDGS